jgi:predicted AAA+ superfamily ATPase
MYSINRHIEPIIAQRARNSKAILLTGPRQVGKSTLFKHLFGNVNQVTFDDDLLLAQAAEDIGLFMLNNPTPLMIDEVQKCPSIFNRIKIILDGTDHLSNFYLTGSQKLQLMENVSDSLAGRISIVELDGLSFREIYGVKFNQHFVPSEDYIEKREKHLKSYGTDIWNIIHRGSYPELYANPEREWIDYYQSYVKNLP